MKVCFFGSYDKKYGRNAVIINSLKKAGFDVLFCHESAERHFLVRAFFLFFHALRMNFDVLWVGFPGHLETIPAKLVCILKRKPLVFDVFISKYDSNYEYGVIKNKNSFNARMMRLIDKISCTLSDLVFLDTSQHIDFFVNEFGIPRSKFEWVFVGANENLFYPRKKESADSKFKILFYGHVTPLHGFEYILKSAELLESNKNVLFTFIGANVYFRVVRSKYQHLKNCVFKDTIPIEQLSYEIANSDVCLGGFGKTPKTDRVIMNKIFEPIAMGKPVITSENKAMNNLFENMKNIIIVKKESPEEIKDAILLLMENKKLRSDISKNALDLFNQKFNSEQSGAKLKKSLEALINK